MNTVIKTPTSPVNGTPLRKPEAKIFKTSAYGLFKRITGNRHIDEAHVNRLKESIRVNDLMIPIVVNENMEVIDGQHRLEARKSLGIPVWYVLIPGLGVADTQKANINNKNWIGGDFLNYYVEQNYHGYKEVRRFMDKYKLSIQISTVLLAGYHIRTKDFRNGELMVNKHDLERANYTAECLCEIGKYYKGYKRRSFVLAFIRVLQVEGFDFDELISKLSYQSSKMVDCTDVNQYLELLEEVYNYKRSKENRIRFN